MESMLDILPTWVWATWALVSTVVASLTAKKWLASPLKWLYSRLFPPKRVKILGQEYSRGEGMFARLTRSQARSGHPVCFYKATVVTLDHPVMIHKLSIITLDGDQFFARQEGVKGMINEELNHRIQPSDHYEHAFKGASDGIFSPVVAIRVEFRDDSVVIERPLGLFKYAQGLMRLRAKE